MYMFLQKQQCQCTKRKERLRLRERRDTDLSNGTGPSFKLLQMAENDGFEKYNIFQMLPFATPNTQNENDPLLRIFIGKFCNENPQNERFLEILQNS